MSYTLRINRLCNEYQLYCLNTFIEQWSHFVIAVVGEVVKNVCNFSHHMADLVIHGKATSNSAPIEQGEGTWHLSISFNDHQNLH